MPPKEKVKLNKSPEINLIWTDDGVQLLLESVRNFKTQKVCGSTTLSDPTTSQLFSSSNVKLSICSSKLRTPLAYNHS